MAKYSNNTESYLINCRLCSRGSLIAERHALTHTFTRLESSMEHIPVLKEEVLTGLDIQPADIVVDMTLGDGGHSLALCGRLSEKGALIGIDQDSRAINYARERLKDCGSTLYLEQANFEEIEDILHRHDITHIDKALYDLGLRTGHIEDTARGFTFKKNEPLLMTMKADPGPDDLTAKEIVNTWKEETLADIIYGFGEERFARRIARSIVQNREIKPIETTFDLIHIITTTVPSWYTRKKIHPATKTFQALRIAVNNELGVLEKSLEKTFEYLRQGGRIAVISYHSIEDRLVKRMFKGYVNDQQALLVHKKPIAPSREETIGNPKARSAKLRLLEKL